MFNGPHVHVVCTFKFEIPWAQDFCNGRLRRPIHSNRRQPSSKQWAQLWESRFMFDMCNGLRIKLNKFRRQASDGTPLDFDHFRFVGSIYPGKMCLSHALMQARANYPAQGRLCLGTTLCISHQCRIITNRAVNENEARSDAIFVPANPVNRSEANQPQDMYIYKGIVLIAKCKGNAKYIKNGVRHKVKEFAEEEEKKHNLK